MVLCRAYVSLPGGGVFEASSYPSILLCFSQRSNIAVPPLLETESRTMRELQPGLWRSRLLPCDEHINTDIRPDPWLEPSPALSLTFHYRMNETLHLSITHAFLLILQLVVGCDDVVSHEVLHEQGLEEHSFRPA